jgi:hypothetical protein
MASSSGVIVAEQRAQRLALAGRRNDLSRR